MKDAMLYPGLVTTALVAFIGIGYALYCYYNEAAPNQYENGPKPKKTNSSTFEKPDVCTICFESFQSTSGLLGTISINCGHVFHGDCLLGWQLYGTQESKNTCPTCRRRFSF